MGTALNDEGWEQRMADRTAARAEAARLLRKQEEDDDRARRMANPSQTIETYLEALSMTVEEAQCLRANPIACACAGAPPELSDVPGAPCYCMLRWMKIERVLEQG